MALPRVYRICQDAQGNIVPEVLGSVLNHGTGVLAQLYNDAAATQPLTNPMTSDATYGSFKFYVAPGHYDLTFSKPGYTFEPVYDFQVPDDNVTLGTMATQNAASVAITGGQIVGLSALNVQGPVGIRTPAASFDLDVNATDNGMRVLGPVAIGGTPDAAYLLRTYAGTVQVDGRLTMGTGSLFSTNNRMVLRYAKDTDDCLAIVPSGSDTGGGSAVLFRNVAGAIVGSISTTASATAYTTSSDVRLKDIVETLNGALDVVRALRPVSFRWRADGSKGIGFLAHELMRVVPEAVTGEPDAVHEDGSVRPQQVDQGRLLPWAMAGMQELLTMVESLTARVTTLEQALGL